MQNPLVESAIRAFAQWREKKALARERIPEDLLKIAAQVSEQIGRSQTVKKLGIGWYRLSEAREKFLDQDTDSQTEPKQEDPSRPPMEATPNQTTSKAQTPRTLKRETVPAVLPSDRSLPESRGAIAVTKIVSATLPGVAKAQAGPPVELISPGGWTIRLDPESSHARSLGHAIVMEILQHERGSS